ncbi:MAG TPA: FAD-binding oxidoreductase [Solirubrobacteraceae bacterium]|nr:FAD-binding oxidoreductase [Solirubrobacteraceae bacterium]
MPMHKLAPAVLDQLAGAFDGEIVRPGDPAYDDARSVWNGMIDRRPEVIARCARTSDVVAAVGFARDSGLPVAVRGGGHSAPGYGTCDGGIVIDLSPMKEIVVDPDLRTARAGAGLTWGEFDAATQEHGLAVTGGRFSTTGIAGLTLGSGSGWLERKCGLTADSLLSAEVVLADGRVVTASAEENADLFWALRGGSGNFGIVTSFEFGLHRVGPLIYGGMLLATPDRADAILRCMRDLMPGAPDDLGAVVAFISAPPAPFVPEEARGKPVVGIVVCWTGDHEEGERVVAPLREAAQPVADLVGPMPYTALQSMLDESGPKGTRAYMKAEFLDELGDEVIETLMRRGRDLPGPLTQILLEPMGGAISRVGDDETALGRRDAAWCYHALAMWMDPSPEAEEAHVAWARGLAEELEPHTTPGVYLNFTSDQGTERVRSSYGAERYERLVALKDRYDPANLFALNQNIPPSTPARE